MRVVPNVAICTVPTNLRGNSFVEPLLSTLEDERKAQDVLVISITEESTTYGICSEATPSTKQVGALYLNVMITVVVDIPEACQNLTGDVGDKKR